MSEFHLCACIGPQGNCKECPCAIRANKDQTAAKIIDALENKTEQPTSGNAQSN